MKLETIWYYLAVLRSRFFVVVASFFVFVAAGILVVHWWTPVYEATATLVIERPQISETLAASSVQDDTIARLGVIRHEMLSDTNLLALADRFRLDGGAVGRDEDRLVKALRKRLSIDWVAVDLPRGADPVLTFAVTFEDGDPIRATAVVNDVVGEILKANRDNRLLRAEDTVAFFDGEVGELEAALGTIESKILQFKSDNIENLPESLGFHRTQQAALENRLLQLGTEESGLRVRRASLVEIAGTSLLTPSGGSASPAQQSLAELQRTLDEQRAIFSEDSPTVLALKARIEAHRGAVLAAATDPTDTKSLTAFPELRLQLSEIDTRLAAIAEERANATAELERTERAIAATPAAESALNELTRDYESTRARYLTAVSRRAEAIAGQQIELGAKSQRLLLLEPAKVPDRPARPKRLPVVGASVAGGIGFGIALILLLELVNRSVRRPSEVADSLGYEPLVAIGHIERPNERVQRHARVILYWVATAIAGIGLVLLVDATLMPLDAVAARIAGLVGLSHP